MPGTALQRDSLTISLVRQFGASIDRIDCCQSPLMQRVLWQVQTALAAKQLAVSYQPSAFSNSTFRRCHSERRFAALANRSRRTPIAFLLLDVNYSLTSFTIHCHSHFGTDHYPVDYPSPSPL